MVNGNEIVKIVKTYFIINFSIYVI